MIPFPKYLIRPDDHEIFSLNEDGETYSAFDSKLEWPDNLHHKYKYNPLIRTGFYVAQEWELPYHKQMQDEYFKRLDEEYQKNKGCGYE